MGNATPTPTQHVRGKRLAPAVLGGLLGVACFIFGAIPVAAAIPQSERDALIALYESTDGASWTNDANWLGAPGSECSWYGVTCDLAQEHVAQLSLAGNNLQGSLPPELGQLSQLSSLRLGTNQISGSIPSELGNLTTLSQLWLHENQLSGNIPSSLGNLTSLEQLWLNDNRLRGILPPSLGNLSNLTDLRLGGSEVSQRIGPGNRIGGELPSTFENLDSLSILDLEGNDVTGLIPEWVGSLVNLTQLRVARNRFRGALPASMGNLALLESMTLRGNALIGEIPSSFTNLTNVSFLELQHNGLATTNGAVNFWASSRQADWADTQTVPPTDVQASEITANDVTLEWTPITYVADGGGYEIFADDGRGPQRIAAATSKSDSSAQVFGLQPDTEYLFTIKTVTNSHFDNNNRVVSLPSDAVTVTTLSAPVPPRIVVTANPRPMLQEQNTTGATTTFSLENRGGSTTIILLQRSGEFFEMDTSEIEVPAGENRTILLAATAQPAGTYTGAVELSGDGVPPDLSIAVSLISHDTPGAAITDVEPVRLRVDAVGSGPVLSGSVGFRNVGDAAVTGVVTADAPWLIPDASPVTIEPDEQVSIDFVVNRSYRPEPESLETRFTTVRFVYPPVGSRTTGSTSTSGGASETGVTVADTPSNGTETEAVPDIGPGQVGLVIPWLRSLTFPNGSIVTDLVVGSTLSDENLGLFMVGSRESSSSATSTVRPLRSSVPLALANPLATLFGRIDGTGSVHLRSSVASSVDYEATTTVFDDTGQRLLFRETPQARSDRGARQGETLHLTGLSSFEGTPGSLRVQEVAGDAATFDVELLDAYGSMITTMPVMQVGAFELLESPLPELPTIATIVIRNRGPGRVFALLEDQTAALDRRSVWDSTSMWGGSRSEEMVIPFAQVAGGAGGTRRRPVRRSGQAQSASAESDATRQTTLAIYSRTGGLIDIAWRGQTQSQSIRLDMETGETLTWSSISHLLRLDQPERGSIVVRPISGEFTPVAWLVTRDQTQEPVVLTLPVLPRIAAITLGEMASFLQVTDSSTESLEAGLPGAVTPSLGLIEESGQNATVVITVSYSESRSSAAVAKSQSVDLAAHSILVIDDVVRAIVGDARENAPDLYSVAITVRVSSGDGSVIPYLLSRSISSGDVSIRVR